MEGPQGGPLDMPLNKRIKTTARKTSSKDYENIKAEEQDVDDAAVGKEAEADDKPPRKETKKVETILKIIVSLCYIEMNMELRDKWTYGMFLDADSSIYLTSSLTFMLPHSHVSACLLDLL